MAILSLPVQTPNPAQHRRLVPPGILTAQMMAVIDATSVSVALPHLRASLGLSGSVLSWVLNASPDIGGTRIEFPPRRTFPGEVAEPRAGS
jgi:hypothetical protein